MEQGQIWLMEGPSASARPCLVLTRSDALPVLNSVTIAPITRTIRGIPTELPLGVADGLRVDSVATFDNVLTVSRGVLTRRLAEISPGRWHEVCAAMRAAIDC